MAESILGEVFEEIYLEHTVNHIISGKVTRSLRARIMVKKWFDGPSIINTLTSEGKIDQLEFEGDYKRDMVNGMCKEEIEKMR